MNSHIQKKIMDAVAATVILIVIGILVYRWVENWSIIDSAYFAVSTLTTVGFGDLHPTHTFSRVFTIFYMLVGISVMLYTVTLVGTYTVESGVYSKPFSMFRKKIHETGKTAREVKLAGEIEGLIEKLNLKTRELESEQQKNGKVEPRYKNRKENN